MLISKKQLKNHVCSDDDSRRTLMFIRFDKKGAMSTDGKRAMLVPYPTQNPSMLRESVEEAAKAEFTNPVLIHKNDAAEIASGMKPISLPVHGKQIPLVAISSGGMNQSEYFVVQNNIDSDKRMAVKRSDPGNFPEVDNFFDIHEGDLTLRFTLKLLADLLNKMAAAAGPDQPFVEFRFSSDPLLPIQIATFGDERPGVRGCIMQCRTTEAVKYAGHNETSSGKAADGKRDGQDGQKEDGGEE